MIRHAHSRTWNSHQFITLMNNLASLIIGRSGMRTRMIRMHQSALNKSLMLRLSIRTGGKFDTLVLSTDWLSMLQLANCSLTRTRRRTEWTLDGATLSKCGTSVRLTALQAQPSLVFQSWTFAFRGTRSNLPIAVKMLFRLKSVASQRTFLRGGIGYGILSICTKGTRTTLKMHRGTHTLAIGTFDHVRSYRSAATRARGDKFNGRTWFRSRGVRAKERSGTRNDKRHVCGRWIHGRVDADMGTVSFL